MLMPPHSGESGAVLHVVAFPDIAQAVQGAADDIIGKACTVGAFEMVLQERRRAGLEVVV
jgi:hypothetical protein